MTLYLFLLLTSTYFCNLFPKMQKKESNFEYYDEEEEAAADAESKVSKQNTYSFFHTA